MLTTPGSQSSILPTTSTMPSSIRASSFIRKMRGGSQAILIEGTDGGLYVVKMMGNPQGNDVLANELIGTALCSAVGFTVPQYSPIYIDSSFIADHPQLWFETTNGDRRRPVAGLHYGAWFVGDTEGPGRAIELLTEQQHAVSCNSAELLGIYLFDAWANNCDRRQILFQRIAADGTLSATFIDNGSLFGGSPWLFDDAKQCLFRKRDVSAVEWEPDQIRVWLDRFRTVIPNALQNAIRVVPRQWCSGELTQLETVLLQRLTTLEMIAQKWNPSHETFAVRVDG